MISIHHPPLPVPSHQLEFALQVKSDEKLAMSEGSSGLEGQTMADAVLSTGVLNVGLIEGKEICWVLGFGLSPVCAAGGIWSRICALRVE